jgi:hypothetical protein
VNDVEVVKEGRAWSGEKEFRSSYLLCHHFFGDATPHTYLCVVLDRIQIPGLSKSLPRSPLLAAHTRPPPSSSLLAVHQNALDTITWAHNLWGVHLWQLWSAQCIMNHVSHPQTILDFLILREWNQAPCFPNNLHIDIQAPGWYNSTDGTENHAQSRSFGAPDSPCFLAVLHAGSPTQLIFKAADTLQALIYGSIQLDPFCTSLALPRATIVLDMSSDVASLYPKKIECASSSF